MAVWLAWLVASISTIVCLFLWFRDVRRIMRERMNTVESAAAQLDACRKKPAQAVGDPDAAAVLARSEDIYRQAVDLYHQHLRKPWIWLPATLMGFRTITE